VPLLTGPAVDDARDMPFTVMLAVVLMGAGAVSAAVVGLKLPEDARLGAGLALVLGAGVGVAVLAVGLFIAQPPTPSGAAGAQQVALLVASVAGLLAVEVGLGIVWRRAGSTRS